MEYPLIKLKNTIFIPKIFTTITSNANFQKYIQNFGLNLAFKVSILKNPYVLTITRQTFYTTGLKRRKRGYVFYPKVSEVCAQRKSTKWIFVNIPVLNIALIHLGYLNFIKKTKDKSFALYIYLHANTIFGLFIIKSIVMASYPMLKKFQGSIIHSMRFHAALAIGEDQR